MTTATLVHPGDHLALEVLATALDQLTAGHDDDAQLTAAVAYHHAHTGEGRDRAAEVVTWARTRATLPASRAVLAYVVRDAVTHDPALGRLDAAYAAYAAALTEEATS